MTDARQELHEATDLIRAYQRDPARSGLLAEAIARLEALVDRLPETDDVLPAALTNLSVALRHRSPNDLDAAIRAADRSVALTAPHDSWYGSRINNRGSALRDRYQRTSVIRDLQAAVADQVYLLDHGLVPDSHRAMLTNNAAQGLRELWEITLDRSYLRQAAARHRMAVRLARRSGNSHELPMILQHAGITIRNWRPDRAGYRAAIALQEEAVARTGTTDVRRPGRVASLAWSWHELSRLEPSAAATAVALFDQALDATPVESSERAGQLLGRAESREHAGDRDGALADYDASLDAALASSPISALDTARQSASLAARTGDLPLALGFARRGLRALDEVLGVQVLRRDQRSWQRHAEQLAADAALLHLQLGMPDDAVRVLDDTRARESWLLAAAARLDPDDPNPEVRHARRAVEDWLERGGPASDEPLDRLLGLLVTGDLVEGRSDRHTAYLTCAELGGAILVVRPDRTVDSRLLPELTLAAVNRRRQRLRLAYDRRIDFPRALAACGGWLGQAVVGPLLELIPDDAPLVVVPCGPFAELPLLTARRGRRHLLLGRPMLLAASGRAASLTPAAPQSRNAVAVLGTTSPVDRFRTAEAEALTRYGTVRMVAERDPQEVLRELSGAAMIHFSAHGLAGRTDAVETAVYLPGGAAIRAPDILRTDLGARPLVFLASCETASPDPDLPDQTFGPAAAFLRAGAAAVIAPLFAVSRHAATLVAARFYHELASASTPQQALARAQRWLASATVPDQLAFLDDLITTVERAGLPVGGLRALVHAISRHTERQPALTGDALWSLFTVSV